MKKWLSDLLDLISNYFAPRKGALVIFGIVLIVLNWFIAALIPGNFLASTNLFLHLGLIFAFVGVLLKWIL